ncbi:hypothetical protein [Candidatus Phytoplasma melaleucae]|uniref:Immunodominant membrane protein n=1 Tax=Candidatus Phytoplasma melaleucae TaxID=2982630 RepID=A0ABT9DEP0_9MOLU|nr:hypothetical protein ['Melaleuca sp.' phytoplasma]MDO8168051.1 hypothetical protein ['Melaleuca sp.' phytoplasma]
MIQKENFLQTKNGKIIAGAVSGVGLVLIYFVAAWFLNFFPFGNSILTQSSLDKLAQNLKLNDTLSSTSTNTVEQEAAKKAINTLSDACAKIKEALDKHNRSASDDKKIQETTFSKLNDLKTKIDAAKKESDKISDFSASAFLTAYRAIKQNDIQVLINAIQTDASITATDDTKTK